MAKKDKGLIDKYNVKRTDGRDGPGSKHYRCALFVLDLTHDRHARQVLYGYGARINRKKPQLAKDLYDLLDLLEEQDKVESTEVPPKETPAPDINIDIPDPYIGEKFDKEALSRLMADVLSAGTFEIQREIGTRFECAICDSPLGRPIGLIGGFDTILCTTHSNAWHVFIDKDPLFMLLDTCMVDRNIAMINGDRTIALAWQKTERDTKRSLFGVGERWVKHHAAKYQMELAKMRLEVQRRGPQGHQET